jgi:hypothetical protein
MNLSGLTVLFTSQNVPTPPTHQQLVRTIDDQDDLDRDAALIVPSLSGCS